MRGMRKQLFFSQSKHSIASTPRKNDPNCAHLAVFDKFRLHQRRLIRIDPNDPAAESLDKLHYETKKHTPLSTHPSFEAQSCAVTFLRQEGREWNQSEHRIVPQVHIQAAIS